MDQILLTKSLPTPVRASTTDDPADILTFALRARRHGPVALATLVEIRGGAARALGSHIAVASDGSFCGYVSGGCVEAAVAAEALIAIEEGRDRTVKFGDGSPFIDIVLPCGGGITIAIHLLRSTAAIEVVLERLDRRLPAGLRYGLSEQSLVPVDAPRRACWIETDFVTVYRPRTRLLISGRSAEAETAARLAEAAGYDVTGYPPADLHCTGEYGIDPFTAVVLLHHDLDLEEGLLQQALASPAFYIGALGSTRTHHRRLTRLETIGYDRKTLDRIKAPIGLFGPTRDATSLALSVLADVAAARLATYA